MAVHSRTAGAKSVIEPFEKANPGIKVKIATGLTMQTVAMMRAQKDDAKIDVIMMDEIGAAQANAEGLYLPLSPAKVTNIEKLYPQFRTPGILHQVHVRVSGARLQQGSGQGGTDLLDGHVGQEVPR